MATTFDLYLLRRYLQFFIIMFVSCYGLYVVFDGFTNVDAYQQGASGTQEVLLRMGRFYGMQSAVFLEMVGSILSVISVMSVFAMLMLKSEIQPVLAAGIPLYRLTLPFVFGSLVTSGVMVVNQELVLPKIGHYLASRTLETEEGQRVEPIYDYKTHIHIDGEMLYLQNSRMEQAQFVLPGPEIVQEITTLKAENAFYVPANELHPSGWVMDNVSPAYDELPLTDSGQKIVRPVKDSPRIFVVTDVSFDQLYQRNGSYKNLSTPDLIRRINNPSFGLISLRNQTLHLHSRLTKPIANLISIFLVAPLIIRRESRKLITNMAVCTGVLTLVLATSYGFQYLGSEEILPADVSAWGPLILSGGLAAWLTGVAQS